MKEKRFVKKGKKVSKQGSKKMVEDVGVCVGTGVCEDFLY